jgi:ribA/ribD-fused uncharacterized protein
VALTISTISTPSSNINIMAPSTAKDTSEPIYFYSTTERPHGIFSQFQKCTFTDPKHPDINFNTAEQYMMYNKAQTFNNPDIASQILVAKTSGDQKDLGRKVRDFKDAVWDPVKLGIVERGNYLKFSQNEEYKKVLLETGDRLLVEAAGNDKIWGIGYNAASAKRVSRDRWGQNLLGIALINVRTKIRNEDAGENGSERVDESDQDTTDDEADKQSERLRATVNSSTTKKRKHDSIAIEDSDDESTAPKTTSSKKACVDLTAEED